MFTRMKQFSELVYWEYYCFREMSVPKVPMTGYHRSENLMITYENIRIKIEPAVFGKIEYYPGTPIANLNKKPARGYDEVVCEGNGVTVFMTLWFTEQGYHAIIWDKEEKQQ